MKSMRKPIGLLTFVALFSCDSTDVRRPTRRSGSSTPNTSVDAGATGVDAGTSTGCIGDSAFTGQIGDTEVPNGGTAIFTPYPTDYNAGIENLISAISQIDGETADVNIMITGATVVATLPNAPESLPQSNTTFWVADSNGTIEVRIFYPGITEAEYPSFAIKTGQKISFRVTKVERFYERGQVQQATDWILEETNQPVYIWEPNRELNTTDVHQFVRINGRLEGEGTNCGTNYKCLNIDYGQGTPAIFRTPPRFGDTGSCVTFVGPVSSFDGALQFNVENLSWLKLY